jgi:hypothetical protein
VPSGTKKNVNRRTDVKAVSLAILKFPLLILLVWGVILSARLITVGGVWDDVESLTWVLFLASALVYFLAMFFGVFLRCGKTVHFDSFSLDSKRDWIQRLSLISIFGAALIVYEFAITRGYGFSTPVSVIRITEVDAATAGFEGSWISGVGRLLTPALMVAWVLAVLGWSEIRRRTLMLLCVASVAVFYQQMMFEGGRFYLAALLLMVFFTKNFASLGKKKSSLNVKRILFWLFLFILALLAFGYVFVARYQQDDRVFAEAYETWAANFDLSVDEGMYTKLSGAASGLWLGIYMLWAYVTQGVNELNTLLMHGRIDMAWGASQFPQITQAINKLTGVNLAYDQLQNLPKVGTYITLYGSSYIDFGLGGALVFFGAIGWLTGRAIKTLGSQRVNGLALNAPLLIALGMFAPIVSLTVNLWPAFCWALLVGMSVKNSSSVGSTGVGRV